MPDRSFTTDFWTDAEDWTREQIVVFFYICTNPQTNVCGLYKCTLAQISDALKMEIEDVKRIVAELEDMDLLVYDSRLLFIRSYSKRQHAEKLNGWKRHLEKAYSDLYKPDNRAAEAFLEKFREQIFRNPEMKLKTRISDPKSPKNEREREGEPSLFGTLPPTVPTTLLSSNTGSLSNTSLNLKGGLGEKNQKQEASPEALPASSNEVAKFLAENGCQNAPQEAKKFFNHYQARGWILTGDQPCRDWRALAVRWLDKPFGGQTAQTSRQNGSTANVGPPARIISLPPPPPEAQQGASRERAAEIRREMGIQV